MAMQPLRIRVEITESDVKQFVEKYPYLKREEWQFLECFDWELLECWFYEFTRESLPTRQLIAEWRGNCHAKTFDEFLWLVRSTLSFRAPISGRLFEFCPEWPRDPYLSVPVNERKRRLKLLYPNSIESLAAKLYPKTPGPGELPLEVTNMILELAGLQKEFEDVTLRIPLGKSHREIMRSFSALLKTKSPFKAKPNVVNRSRRADLKALGAYRILEATGDDYINAPQLYSDQSKWINARVKTIIRSFDTSAVR